MHRVSVVTCDAPRRSVAMASVTKTEKRKRFVLTLRQKIDICKMLDNGVRRSDIMREFNISSSTLYDIKARKDELIKFCAESESDKVIMKRKVLSKPKLEQLDTVLYKWFRSKRSEGISVSGPMLIEKAKDFYKQMNLNDKCTFSEGWLSCFKQRHGITKHNISGEQKSADHESVEQYCETYASLIKEHDLKTEQIYNADKSVLFWRCLPSFAAEDSDQSDTAEFKSRMTVLYCANAAGTHKLKLLVVGNYSSSIAFKNITDLPVLYKSQHNSWIDKEIFYEWFHHNFAPEVKEHFRKIGMPEDSKAALLLDNSSSCFDESRLVSGNIFTIYLPANVTSLIQPMDQGIIRSMKCNYKRDLLRKLVSHNDTVQNFQANFNLKDAIYSLAAAWTAVKSTTLRKAWRKLWPDSALEDKSSDEEFEILNDRSNFCISFLSDARNSHSSNSVINLQDIIQTWLNEDLNHTVSDAENVVCVLNHNSPSTEQSTAVMKEKTSWDIAAHQLQILNQNSASTEQPTVVKKASWDIAAHHLQEFIRFAEISSSYSPMEIVNLHILQTIFENKRKQSIKPAIYDADL